MDKLFIALSLLFIVAFIVLVFLANLNHFAPEEKPVVKDKIKPLSPHDYGLTKRSDFR